MQSGLSIINTGNKGILLCLLFGFVLVYHIFGKFLLDPNGYMFAYGGDAFVIYYNIMYHTCYGSGTTLSAMNYPYGEYIFMTDAQGIMSYTLNWINVNLFEVCDYVLGIIHFVNIFLLFVAILFVYFILIRLNTIWWLASIFSPLIILLSPQILRFGGHFGLAYPFIIPLSLLWFLRKERIPRFEWRDLLVFVTLLLFTFNNPYIGFVAVFPLLILSGIRLLFKGDQKYRTVLITVCLALLVLAIPYATFKLNDIVTDRIKIQWGFFFYNVSLEGLIYPITSPIYDLLLNWKLDPYITDPENKQYLGIVNILVLTIGSFWLIVKSWKKSFAEAVKNQELLILATSAILIFLLTSRYLWNNVNEEWIESYLGFILMFKAISRLNWAFYFIASLLCISIVNKFYTKYRKIGVIAILSLSSIWLNDIQYYIVPNFANSIFPNYINKEYQNEFKSQAFQLNIDTSNYQAIIVLPKMMAWNDNILSTIHFNSQHYSMKLSLATGLPLVSSMLSRMSISQTADAIQLLSHPWIKKELAYKFPNDKPMLLLLGKDHPVLDYGESHLTTLGDTIIDNKNFTIWSLPIANLQNDFERNKLCSLSNKTIPKSDFLYLDFDSKPTESHKANDVLFGKGLKLVEKGDNLIIDTLLSQSGNVELSLWVYLDYERHGIGQVKVVARDSLGITYMEQNIDPRTSNDINNSWLRTKCTWNNKPNSQIIVSYFADKKTSLDELLIRSIQDTIYQKVEDKLSANGYNIN